MTFEEARDRLIAARKAWYAMTGSTEDMHDAAKAAANIYNEKARAVAKRLGVKAQLTTADKIMRNIDRSVR